MGSFSVKYGPVHKHGGYRHSDNGGGHPAIRGMPGLNKKIFRPFGPQFGLKIRGEGGPGSPSPFPISATDERVKKLDLEVEPPRIKVTLSTRPSPEKNVS